MPKENNLKDAVKQFQVNFLENEQVVMHERVSPLSNTEIEPMTTCEDWDDSTYVS